MQNNVGHTDKLLRIGAAVILLGLGATGVIGWWGLIGLVPLATERAFVWLLPAVALFLAGLQLSSEQRGNLLKLLVAAAALSVVLGLAQLFGGPDSALRFYSNTNPTEAVGFFANRNHLASLLVIALPFVVVGTARWLGHREEWNPGTVLGLLGGIGLLATNESGPTH